MPLSHFHPIVRQWFNETLGAPSEPQRLGWPAIAEGEHTLILAPTGTGKTLAAFLWELDRLIVDGLKEPLPNAVQILYISPLKAFNNDVQRNLERPLAELRARFEAADVRFPEIRVAVRTGDTPASARARMIRRSPHILITTPESLNIMLTTERGRGMVTAVRAVIVDEIHAVAGTKRGAHLALTLERLEALCDHSPQRIGLSATQRPLEEIAKYLGGLELGLRLPGSGGGSSRRDLGSGAVTSPDSIRPVSPGTRPTPEFRSVTVIDCGLVKQMELAVVSPVPDLGDVGGSVWPKVVPLVLEYIRAARTTLVFVNNRAQAERIAAKVNALAEEEVAQPYHGSLARERRLVLEEALKGGRLAALVTTSSLELGIDIGSVDLVIQLQSPKRVASGLQRVGRAGHSLGAVSRGVLVPTFRDDLVEITAIVDAMREGAVEPTRVPQNALDVLAQAVVAAVSVDDWRTDDLFDLVRRAYPYHRLTRAAFDEVLAMLSGKYLSGLSAELEPRITWDRMSDRLSGSRGSRMLAVISGGTIPDRGYYTVNLPDRTRLGELDEEFVHESRVGDVFQLGSSTWRIAAVEHDRVIVHPAPGAPARMPFWHGEYAARAVELAGRIGEVRRAASREEGGGKREEGDGSGEDRIPGALLPSPVSFLDAASWNSLRSYMAEQRVATGVVPDERIIVIEHFRDETGSVRIVVHSVFGGRVNAPWGIALAQRVRETVGHGDVQVQTTDDGIMLRLPDLGGMPPMHAMLGMSPHEAERRVIEEIGATSLFGARFRMNAARALLLPRGSPRRRMPLWLQRLKSRDLLDAVRQFPSFPILLETYREVLQDAFDMPALSHVLGELAAGRIAVRTVEGAGPSPFAASLQFGFVMDWMYGDDTPRAEQRAAMLALDRALLDEVMGTEGADDDTTREIEALLAERRGTAPGYRARTADELAHRLDRAGDITPDELRERVAPREEWAHDADPMEDLLASGRAIGIPIPTARGDAGALEWRIILTETFPRYAAVFGVAALEQVRAGTSLEERAAVDVVPPALLAPVMEPRVARREVLARFVALAGPITVDDIRARYDWPARWVESRLTDWEQSGKLVRLRANSWCSRRIVEAARRRALAALRRQIEAVEFPVFAAFLQRWQHVDPRDHLAGVAGLEMTLRQLEGLPRPPAGWERDYFPARLSRYDPSWLSQLGAAGQVVWAGGARHDIGTALGSVRFFRRGAGALWMAENAAPTLGEGASIVREALARLGASFLADLQQGSPLGPLAVKNALRELAAAGLVTNDTVEALRELIRTRALPRRPGSGAADPTRWLPASYTPTPGRRVVHARPSIRRLPKWRRPDLPGPASGWAGRWSLLRSPGTWGTRPSEDEHAALVARQWLDRYGIVARDWWRRERPPVPWRAIYRELKRLELRGEVRRGYFVKGLAGAQFVLPEAVERLREAAAGDENAALVVMAASDPANPYSLPPDPTAPRASDRDALARPRGTGALLVTRRGAVVLSAESCGRRVRLATRISADEVTAAAEALADYVRSGTAPGRPPRDLVVETIDGAPAITSPHADSFARAGFRRGREGMVRYWG